jgi:uncharacterized protein
MSSQIVDFRSSVASETTSPPPERLVAGAPRQRISNYFSDPGQQFHSGRWASTRGKWRIHYTESEFCCLTQGRVALENAAGQRWEFGVGEAFVVPAGFEGTWEVIDDCTKFYALFEPRT